MDRYLEIEEEVCDYRTRRGIAHPVTIVAVSKGVSIQAMQEVMRRGCYDFGESYLPEFFEKNGLMPNNIRWHMIGPLQTKKLPKLIGQFTLIHSVSDVELLRGIAERSERAGLTTSVLLQSNTSGEKSKQGLPPEAWEEVWPSIGALKGVKIEGLMTMAPLTEDHEVIRNTFADLRKLRDRLQQQAFPHTPLYHLSMGMSHDWRIALEEGATLLRIGRQIFQVE